MDMPAAARAKKPRAFTDKRLRASRVGLGDRRRIPLAGQRVGLCTNHFSRVR
jgi:hypothetical protein